VSLGAVETLRLSGVDKDLNAINRYQVIKPRILAMDIERRRGQASPSIFKIYASRGLVARPPSSRTIDGQCWISDEELQGVVS
jgi:hypothetical protein